MDDLSFNTLKAFSIRSRMSLLQLDAVMNTNTIDVMYSLWEKGFIDGDHTDPNYPEPEDQKVLTRDMPFYITFEGRAALEEENKTRHSVKFNEFRAWATLIIALAAFIKSFFLN